MTDYRNMSDWSRRTSNTVMWAAPLFPIVFGMILGILFDHHKPVSISWYVFLLVASSSIALFSSSRLIASPLIILLGAASLGGTIHHLRVSVEPPNSIKHKLRNTKQLARLYGRINSQPRNQFQEDWRNADYEFARWTYRSDRTVFLLDLEAAETADGRSPVTGRVRVTVYESVLDLRENELIEVFGWLHPLYPVRNPGGFDWAAFLGRQGIDAQLRCPHRQNVRRLEPDAVFQSSLTQFFRNKARGFLIDELSIGTNDDTGLLEAMILGQRSQLDRQLNEMFVRAGCIHFLAVSGFHVAVLMSFVWFVCRQLGLRKHRAAWVMAIVIPLYALVVEPRPPILRATILALFYCGSLILQRRRSPLNWLSGAAIILLLINPLNLFDVGFLLSFLVVLGIAYFGMGALRPAMQSLRGHVRQLIDRRRFGHGFTESDRQIILAERRDATGVLARVRRKSVKLATWASETLIVSTGAWLVGVPIVAYFFYRIQPWGILASAAVFPAVYLVMILGFLKVIATAISPWLGGVLAPPLRWSESALLNLVDFFSALPGSTISFPKPGAWLTASYYLLLALISMRLYRRRHFAIEDDSGLSDPITGTRFVTPGLILATFLFLSCATGWTLGRSNSNALIVHSLAVGNGSATVIQFPDNSTILFDAGTSAPYDVGRSTLVPFLRHQGISRIDQIYISHSNLDHFNALPSLIHEIRCGPVFINEHFEARSKAGSPSEHLLAFLQESGHAVEMQPGNQTIWEIGGVQLERLWPPASLDESYTINDCSTVLRLTYAGHSILLTGDIEENAHRELLRSSDLRADVLHLPHHGSVTRTLPGLLTAVGADTLIRSSGERNSETINGLEKLIDSATLLNTADHGAITVSLTDAGIEVTSVTATNSHKK